MCHLNQELYQLKLLQMSDMDIQIEYHTCRRKLQYHRKRHEDVMAQLMQQRIDMIKTHLDMMELLHAD